MRTNRRNIDYGAVARASVKRDFKSFHNYSSKEKVPEIQDFDKITARCRIIHISDTSCYARFSQYIVGKLVVLKERASIGHSSWYCEFVYDRDRKALNAAAGWSDRKNTYLLDGIRFENE